MAIRKESIQPIFFSMLILEDFEKREYIESIMNLVMNLCDNFRPIKKRINDKVTKINNHSDIDKSILVDELTAHEINSDQKKYIRIDMFNKNIEFSIYWAKLPTSQGFQHIYVSLQAKYEMDWNLPSNERFATMSINAKNQRLLNDFILLVKNLIPLVNPVYGELCDLAPIYSTSRPFDLKLRLPDTQQISVYGTPYIELFSRDKIESAPFNKIERLGENHYWLESTSSIFETVSAEKKKEIRQHFGEDYFMDGGKDRLPSGKKRFVSGIAPVFDFSKTIIHPN